jgi:hypothetical protein
MDWITSDSLKTFASATFVVTVVVAVIKKLLPAITGRATHVVALAVSLISVGIVGQWSSASAVFVTVINGFILFLSAMGLDQLANYKKREV